jgi:release factor glutamine methyltransferase
MSSGTEQWTILRLLEWTTDYLSSSDAENPRLDAEVLLASARGCSRIDLYTAFNELADDRVRTAFRELVRRRAEGTPVAYLVGRREFYSRDFRVTPDVLIPRPETEFILTTLLDLVGSDRTLELKIADVGTGSGILAVCAAAELNQAQVTATDLSDAAIEVAKSNAEKHQVGDRIQFVSTDLLESIPAGPTFDFVLSNPPYVSAAEYSELDPSVRDYEPKLALVGGPTGAEIIERLILQAAARLKPDGYLILEISPMIEEIVHEQFARCSQFGDPQTVKDLAQLARVVYAPRI